MDIRTLTPDFKEFLRLLNSKGIRYLLIGGYAVNYYGYVRATVDLDIWVERSSENASLIVSVLNDFGFGGPEVNERLFQTEYQVLRMGVPPFRLELLTSITGVEFAQCYQRRVQADLGGLAVDVISVDDLLANKIATGRRKDLVDVDHLHRKTRKRS